MAQRIAEFHTPSHSAQDLRLVFEAAVSRHPSVRAIKNLHYRAPIVERESTTGQEKRALSDAARALAQLWKVSRAR